MSSRHMAKVRFFAKARLERLIDTYLDIRPRCVVLKEIKRQLSTINLDMVPIPEAMVTPAPIRVCHVRSNKGHGKDPLNADDERVIFGIQLPTGAWIGPSALRDDARVESMMVGALKDAVDVNYFTEVSPMDQKTIPTDEVVEQVVRKAYLVQCVSDLLANSQTSKDVKAGLVKRLLAIECDLVIMPTIEGSPEYGRFILSKDRAKSNRVELVLLRRPEAPRDLHLAAWFPTGEVIAIDNRFDFNNYWLFDIATNFVKPYSPVAKEKSMIIKEHPRSGQQFTGAKESPTSIRMLSEMLADGEVKKGQWGVPEVKAQKDSVDYKAVFEEARHLYASDEPYAKARLDAILGTRVDSVPLVRVMDLFSTETLPALAPDIIYDEMVIEPSIPKFSFVLGECVYVIRDDTYKLVYVVSTVLQTVEVYDLQSGQEAPVWQFLSNHAIMEIFDEMLEARKVAVGVDAGQSSSKTTTATTPQKEKKPRTVRTLSPKKS